MTSSPPSAKMLLDCVSWTRSQHDTVRPACAGLSWLDPKAQGSSTKNLGFVELQLLRSGSRPGWFLELIRVCKKTFDGGCVPDEAPPTAKLVFRSGDWKT
ncbi:hypothetical protein GW17_00021097 [Ensete ventricosum]|nr:hypothetical protein GW17_00021097 [Ensete ventricosum]